jgi:hypothetical protein
MSSKTSLNLILHPIPTVLKIDASVLRFISSPVERSVRVINEKLNDGKSIIEPMTYSLAINWCPDSLLSDSS